MKILFSLQIFLQANIFAPITLQSSEIIEIWLRINLEICLIYPAVEETKLAFHTLIYIALYSHKNIQLIKKFLKILFSLQIFLQANIFVPITLQKFRNHRKWLRISLEICLIYPVVEETKLAFHTLIYIALYRCPTTK